MGHTEPSRNGARHPAPSPNPRLRGFTIVLRELPDRTFKIDLSFRHHSLSDSINVERPRCKLYHRVSTEVPGSGDGNVVGSGSSSNTIGVSRVVRSGER